MGDITVQVGTRIRELRERHGLSQREVAEMVGVSNQTILHIEAGHHRTNVDLLASIARQLGVEPWELLAPESGPRAREVIRFLRTVDDETEVAPFESARRSVEAERRDRAKSGSRTKSS